MEFMLKAEKKLKAFSLFGNKKEEALELYQKGAVRVARCGGHTRVFKYIHIHIRVACSGIACANTLVTPHQICFKQAKKWQEAGEACVTLLPQHNNCDNVRRYQKCADMMLEMRQTHDACTSFLEAAVSVCVCLCVCVLPNSCSRAAGVL
jgi:hypothetical protein